MSYFKTLFIGLLLFPLSAYSADKNSGNSVTAPKATEAVPTQETAEKKVDEATGLIMDAHWELIKNNCIACHSARQILQQRATRQGWTDIIRWMQATQNLWKFDAETEGKILDYLEKNYAPSGEYRRMPIPPMLMPPNPYKVK
jgi:hypothetical protein